MREERRGEERGKERRGEERRGEEKRGEERCQFFGSITPCTKEKSGNEPMGLKILPVHLQVLDAPQVRYLPWAGHHLRHCPSLRLAQLGWSLAEAAQGPELECCRVQ